MEQETSRSGKPRLGFLYPGFAAEDDYPRAVEMLGGTFDVEVVHTTVGEDAHRVDALLDLGSQERLGAGAAALADRRLDAAVWACTSGSFVFGVEGARAQVAAIEALLGIPTSSTSFAFVHAARALGVRRVAIAATYPEDVAQAFRRFLEDTGFEVVTVDAEDIVTATEVGHLEQERVVAIAVGGDHPDAEAVLVPDTAMRTLASIEEMERRLGKPVLTANQVSVWEALRLAGALPQRPGLGRLFATEPADAGAALASEV